MSMILNKTINNVLLKYIGLIDHELFSTFDNDQYRNDEKDVILNDKLYHKIESLLYDAMDSEFTEIEGEVNFIL